MSQHFTEEFENFGGAILPPKSSEINTEYKSK